MHVSRKEFLDIQAIRECRFTLNLYVTWNKQTDNQSESRFADFAHGIIFIFITKHPCTRAIVTRPCKPRADVFLVLEIRTFWLLSKFSSGYLPYYIDCLCFENYIDRQWWFTEFLLYLNFSYVYFPIKIWCYYYLLMTPERSEIFLNQSGTICLSLDNFSFASSWLNGHGYMVASPAYRLLFHWLKT